MRVEATYFPPKRYCPMCRRKLAARNFRKHGRTVPLCRRCGQNFLYHVLTGHP